MSTAIRYFFLSAVFMQSLMLLFTSDADAYLGPGAGLGLIGSLFAAVIVVLVIIFGLILYPVRRFLKRKSQKSRTEEGK